MAKLTKFKQMLEAGLITLSINTGAFMTVIVQSALDEVPRGQWEAARAYGLGYVATMRYVVLPQAGRIAEGTVANAVRLQCRFLDDFGVAGLHLLERTVEVAGMGTFERGTMGAFRFEVQGMVDDRPLLVVEHVTRIDDECAPGEHRGDDEDRQLDLLDVDAGATRRLDVARDDAALGIGLERAVACVGERAVGHLHLEETVALNRHVAVIPRSTRPVDDPPGRAVIPICSPTSQPRAPSSVAVPARASPNSWMARWPRPSSARSASAINVSASTVVSINRMLC